VLPPNPLSHESVKKRVDHRYTKYSLPAKFTKGTNIYVVVRRFWALEGKNKGSFSCSAFRCALVVMFFTCIYHHTANTYRTIMDILVHVPLRNISTLNAAISFTTLQHDLNNPSMFPRRRNQSVGWDLILLLSQRPLSAPRSRIRPVTSVMAVRWLQ
jgi:hypothetical protein